VPKSREEEAAQTEAAHMCIRRTLVESIDAGVPPALMQSTLRYFWFRRTDLRRGLKESFFQKLERRWELVTDRANAYMDQLAEAVRRQYDRHPHRVQIGPTRCRGAPVLPILMNN
jgi:hypothetical protein